MPPAWVTSAWRSGARPSARCSPTRSAPMATEPTLPPPSIFSCASRRGAPTMATYKILYWQEVPSQIKAEDAQDEITLPMPPQFMERIDQLAIQRGLQSSDQYLAQWHWSDEQERAGSAQEVAEAVKEELLATEPRL